MHCHSIFLISTQTVEYPSHANLVSQLEEKKNKTSMSIAATPSLLCKLQCLQFIAPYKIALNIWTFLVPNITTSSYAYILQQLVLQYPPVQNVPHWSRMKGGRGQALVCAFTLAIRRHTYQTMQLVIRYQLVIHAHVSIFERLINQSLFQETTIRIIYCCTPDLEESFSCI